MKTNIFGLLLRRFDTFSMIEEIYIERNTVLMTFPPKMFPFDCITLYRKVALPPTYVLPMEPWSRPDTKIGICIIHS